MGLGPQPGGNSTVLAITAAAVVKAGSGTIFRVALAVPGTAGNLVINDAATTGTAVTANIIASIPFGSLTAPVLLEWPCTNGIVISAIPTGAQVSVSFS